MENKKFIVFYWFGSCRRRTDDAYLIVIDEEQGINILDDLCELAPRFADELRTIAKDCKGFLAVCPINRPSIIYSGHGYLSRFDNKSYGFKTATIKGLLREVYETTAEKVAENFKINSFVRGALS